MVRTVPIVSRDLLGWDSINGAGFKWAELTVFYSPAFIRNGGGISKPSEEVHKWLHLHADFSCVTACRVLLTRARSEMIAKRSCPMFDHLKRFSMVSRRRKFLRTMTIIWTDHYIRFEKWDLRLLFVATAVGLSCCWLGRHCILLLIIRNGVIAHICGLRVYVLVNSTQIGCFSKYGTYNCHDWSEKDSGTNATCALKDDQIKMPLFAARNMTEREDHLFVTCEIW